MKIVKGKVNYIVADDGELIRVDSIDSIYINQPIPENDRCIVVVRVFGEEIGVTHWLSKKEAIECRKNIMVAAGMKSMSRRFIDLFKMDYYNMENTL